MKRDERMVLLKSIPIRGMVLIETRFNGMTFYAECVKVEEEFDDLKLIKDPVAVYVKPKIGNGKAFRIDYSNVALTCIAVLVGDVIAPDAVAQFQQGVDYLRNRGKLDAMIE